MYSKRLICGITMLAFGMSPAIASAADKGAPPKQPKSGHELFLPSAQENRNLDEVRLPAYRGSDASGGPVWFVVTEASSREWAERLGVNYSPKLANTINTGAVMHVAWNDGRPAFPFTPDFSPTRVVIPGAPGRTDCPAGTSPTRVVDDLPVDCFRPGADGSFGQSLGSATGQNSYSPLVQIETPEGPVVLNAAHIANDTGRGDKVLRLEGARSRSAHVVHVEQTGLYEGRTIHYISTDSSIPVLAALEGATFAPALNRSPSTPTNATVAGTSRSGLIGFTNGPEGLGNPERQGINSAIHDGAASPLNVIQFTPDDVDASGETLYSPLWDIHLATWKVAPTRQTDFDAIIANPNIEAADGRPTVHPVFFWVVNCPIVSTDAEGVFVIPPPT